MLKFMCSLCGLSVKRKDGKLSDDGQRWLCADANACCLRFLAGART